MSKLELKLNSEIEELYNSIEEDLYLISLLQGETLRIRYAIIESTRLESLDAAEKDLVVFNSMLDKVNSRLDVSREKVRSLEKEKCRRKELISEMERLQMGIDQHMANAILIQLNQI